MQLVRWALAIWLLTFSGTLLVWVLAHSVGPGAVSYVVTQWSLNLLIVLVGALPVLVIVALVVRGARLLRSGASRSDRELPRP